MLSAETRGNFSGLVPGFKWCEKSHTVSGGPGNDGERWVFFQEGLCEWGPVDIVPDGNLSAGVQALADMSFEDVGVVLLAWLEIPDIAALVGEVLVGGIVKGQLERTPWTHPGFCPKSSWQERCWGCLWTSV